MIPFEQLKEMIERDNKVFSICHQCELLGISRSSLYYTPSVVDCLELEIMKEIDLLYIQDPARGTRRMHKALRSKGYTIGRYKVRSLMRLMRIKTVYCKPRTTICDPAKYKYPYLLRNLPITEANQVWAVDISYIPLKKGFMYLFAIIDLFSRFIVGWSISNTMTDDWVVNTINEAIENHGVPKIINSDQGSQFTSNDYINYLKRNDIQISMDGKGRATDNSFIERFFRTIKHDKIYLELPENGVELHKCCSEFIDFYNNHREHSSLDYETPAKLFNNAA
jgi:putative transposase